MNIKTILKYRLIIGLLFFGISFRLIYGLLFNQMVDYMNVLSLVKSIADTGNLNNGLVALKRIGFEVQLYGKIFYQVLALWLKFLEKIKLLNIDYIFDTKPLTDAYSYMIGLWQWSPLLYQLTAIKLIQFLWDFFFVFFLYKTAKLINKDLAWVSILFWALNPYFMMINYAFFMPDIFMLGAFLAGTYFWLKTIKENKNTGINSVFALFFLTLGAIIKQLPLLIIPFLFVSVIKNKKSFFVYFFIFIFFYLFLKQSWSPDSYLINKFFLFSQESLGLLRNTFNSIPYFLIFYFLFFIFFIKKKVNDILNNQVNILLTIIAIISLVYINDPVSFIQFAIWLLPFTFLISLISTRFLPFFVLNLLALLIKGWHNEFYLSPILSPTIGSMFNEFVSNKVFINQFFNYEIYDLILRFIVFFLYLLILVESVAILFNKNFLFPVVNKLILLFNHKRMIFGFLILWLLFVFADYQLKSSYILLPQKKYQITNEEININKEPIIIAVKNPKGKKIKAVQMLVSKKGKITYDDYVIFDFYKNNEKFFSKKISDFEIPTTIEEPLIIFLKKTINEKSFVIKIYKDKGINEIVTYKSNLLDALNKPENNLFNGYETPDQSGLIKVSFEKKEKINPIYFRGKYEIKDIIFAINHHIQGKLKKIFFGFYLSAAIISIFSGIILTKKNLYKKIV